MSETAIRIPRADQDLRHPPRRRRPRPRRPRRRGVRPPRAQRRRQDDDVEILEGFRDRDGGEVSVLGTDPHGASRAWRDRIGIVLQTSGGLDLLTPREALRSTARCYRDARGVDEVIEATGLAAKADDRIAGLSGGQRRRLDVALGIVGRPELLFLDEPTTGFDPQARRDFWELIRGLAHDGTTILLTTHYLDEAEHLADRVGGHRRGPPARARHPVGPRRSAVAGGDGLVGGGGHPAQRPHGSPTTEVASLAARFGGEVPELTVTRPSLEDTYLGLIAPHVTTERQEVPA